MTFSAIVPLSGYSGLMFLRKTEASQKASIANSAEHKREAEHFRSTLGKVSNISEFMADRRLLSFALGAFGLKDELKNTAFIRKILVEGHRNSGSFANRLVDKRYLDFAKSFDFEQPGGPSANGKAFFDKIIQNKLNHEFNAAVGSKDPTLRLALEFNQGVKTILDKHLSLNGSWYALMGDIATRRVVEGALGLPTTFARLPIDQQVVGFREGLSGKFGVKEVSNLANPALQERIIQVFTARAALSKTGSISSSLSSALQLLRS
jgi:hypothetical protein